MSLPTIPTLRATDYDREGLGTQAALSKFFTQLNPWVQSVGSVLGGAAGGGISPANLNGEIVSFTVTAPTTPNWTALTLTSPWVNFGSAGQYEPAGYYVDPAGVVHLRGTVGTGASTVAQGSTIATLPAAALPAIFSVDGPINWSWCSWGGTTDSMRIDVSAGGVLATVNVGAYALSLHAAPQTIVTSLSGIHYPSASGAVSVMTCFPKQVRLVSLQPPRDVIITSVVDSAVASAPAIAIGAASWNRSGNSPAGTNFINFLNIPGLAPGRTYTIRALVLY